MPMKRKRIVLSVLIALVLGIVLLNILGPVAGSMPLWMSILPPLVAIVMALLIKEVISSLFVGILTGTFLMAYYGGASPAAALGGGMLRVVDTYVVGSLFDADHVKIVVFTMLIGGMVRIITANGGMQGVVNWLSRRAKGPRSGQLMTFLMDLCIFFDDYSNTLVVGNTMRPIADKLKVSREKLAYIVDSTSAPVVAVAFVTTWIGAELSYIQDGIKVIGLETAAYSVFFNSLAYSFYPFLTLGFVLMIILSRRDFGPMLTAERKARMASAMETETSNMVAKPAHIIDALIPLAVLIFGTIIGLIVTGYDASVWNEAGTGFFPKLSATIGAANSYLALLWASLSSLLTAIVMTLLRGDMEFGKIMEEMVEGFKSMFRLLDGHLMGHDGHPLSFDFAFVVAALPRAGLVRRCYHAFVLQCGGLGAGGFRHGRPLQPDFRHYDNEFPGLELQSLAACQDADALRAHRGWRGGAVGCLAHRIGLALMGGLPDGLCRVVADCEVGREEGIKLKMR